MKQKLIQIKKCSESQVFLAALTFPAPLVLSTHVHLALHMHHTMQHQQTLPETPS